MLHKAGDPVPTEWFSKLENVKSIRFACDCSETIENGVRVIRKVGDGMHIATIVRTKRKPVVAIAHPEVYFDGPFAA